MEIAKHLIIMTILIFVGATPARPQEKSAATGSGSRMASCVVRVTSDPAILPLSFQAVRELLHSSGVFGKAARDVLGLAQEEALGLFDIEPLSPDFIGSVPDQAMDVRANPGARSAQSPPGSVSHEPSIPRIVGTRGLSSGTVVPSLAPVSEHTFLFLLKVDFRQADQLSPGRAVKPLAEEFMNALIGNLRDAVARAFDEYKERLTHQFDLAQEESDRAEHELQTWQNRLREISGSYVMDRSSILGEINNLRRSIQEIEMKYVSDQVTIGATTKRIAELQAKIQVEMEKDKITDELKRLLDLQEHNLGNVEKLADSGRASPTDLADAQEKMTRVRVELAQRQEQLNKSKGGDQIGSLNSTLADLSMGMAQYRAELSSYQQQLTQAEALLGKADGYELLSLKADVAKQNLKETLLWRDRMARQIRIIQPPNVSVIGGE